MASEPAGIPCPICGETKSRVRRTTPAAGYVTRRRQCRGCGTRFTTAEKIPGKPLNVTVSAMGVGEVIRAVEFLRSEADRND